LKIDAGESSITSERQGKCEIFPFIIRILLNLVVSKALISKKTKYYAPQRSDKILPNFVSKRQKSLFCDSFFVNQSYVAKFMFSLCVSEFVVVRKTGSVTAFFSDAHFL
jgi:hypothetical protein